MWVIADNRLGLQPYAASHNVKLIEDNMPPEGLLLARPHVNLSRGRRPHRPPPRSFQKTCKVLRLGKGHVPGHHSRVHFTSRSRLTLLAVALELAVCKTLGMSNTHNAAAAASRAVPGHTATRLAFLCLFTAASESSARQRSFWKLQTTRERALRRETGNNTDGRHRYKRWTTSASSA